MDEQPKPYTPHVAYAMDSFRERARHARADAFMLTKQAEVWEEAANALEAAIEKEKRNAEGKKE